MQTLMTRCGAIWKLHPQLSPEALGLLPEFLTHADDRPARTQLHEAYAHGGGWHRFEGFTLNASEPPEAWKLAYPGDPAMRLIGYTRLRDETIALFESSWVAVVAADGTYEIARMD